MNFFNDFLSKIQKNEFHSGFQSFFCLGVVETAASYRGDVTVDVTAVVTARHSMSQLSQHVIETPSPSTMLARWHFFNLSWNWYLA